MHLFSTLLAKNPIYLNFSPGMQLSAEQDGSSAELPITRFLPCKATHMLELIHDSPLPAAGNQNQQKRFDYVAVAVN
jgi:hypothetical protein